MKYGLILTALMLVIGVFGCKQQAVQNDSGNNGIEKSKLLSSSKEALPSKPFLGQNDSEKLGEVWSKFFTFARDGEKQKAVALFLPKTRRTAEMSIAKDIELAKEQPADYAPSSASLVWYQNGKLWPRDGAQELNNGEVDRLITLSKTYEKAVFIVVVSVSGKQRKILAVKHKGKYALLP